jgi:NADH:ubiquinone oxidoreductase subunit C
MKQMTIPEFIEQLNKKFKFSSEIEQRSNKRIYIRIPREHLIDLAKIVFKDFSAKFSIATGIDVREGFEVLYHFTFDKDGFICTIKTIAPRHDPTLNSIVGIIPGAVWIEREIHDILGVKFIGHPNLKRLVKAEYLEDNEYPFRKDFDIKKFKEKHGLLPIKGSSDSIKPKSKKSIISGKNDK